MADKLDYKKEYKDLYQPSKKPSVIDVPAIPFFYVDGIGAPESDAYQNALSVLYALSFTVKMSKMSGSTPPGYFDYVVPPLEGLWIDTPFDDASNPREAWRWTSMIRQPDFVTEEVFQWALAQAAAKKKDIDFSAARYAVWQEGLCVQAMHIGPYAAEPETLASMLSFAKANGYTSDFATATTGLARRHHEIYLGDPRKTAPDKRKTVLRHPVVPV